MLNWNEMNENELIEMAKNGDDEAKMLIINRYKPLVYRFLSQYYSRFSTCSSSLREDLIDDGVLTILECINTYDSSKASFSTHCYYQLRASIQNGLRDTVKGLQHGLTSMDKEMNEDSEDKAQSLYDVVANNVDIEKDYIENEERNHVWEVAKKVCTNKEYATLKAMATDGLTRKEIAEIVGVTESALCGLRNRSFQKLEKIYKMTYHMKEGIEMSKNKEKINKKLDELGRVVVQLHISLLNRKYKYVENDFEAIGRCLAELKELVNNDE